MSKKTSQKRNFSEVGTISGKGTSNVTVDALKRGKEEYNKMINNYHKQNNLLDYKQIDQNFSFEDLEKIANEHTFQIFANYLVETAQYNIAKDLNDNVNIEFDEDSGEYATLASILVYFSNFQNYIVNLDTGNKIVWFNKFRECAKGSAPLFITKIRNRMTTIMNRFCIEKGVMLKQKTSGIDKNQVEQLIQEIRKNGNIINTI